MPARVAAREFRRCARSEGAARRGSARVAGSSSARRRRARVDEPREESVYGPFESVRSLVRSDRHRRRAAGRRQERVARRDVPGVVSGGRARAERLRHHGGRISIAASRDGSRRQASCAARRPRYRGHRESSPAGPIGARRDPRRTLPRAARSGDRRRLRALERRRRGGRRRRAEQRHGRRPARGELRRPAGELPQREGARDAHRGMPALLRLALHRSRDFVPHREGLRPFSGGSLDRRAAHGALRLGVLRRHVLDRHGDRLPRRGADQRRIRPRRERRAGRGQSRRVRGLQADAAGGLSSDRP